MPPKFKRTVSREDLLSAQHEETETLLEQRSGSEEDEGYFLNGPEGSSKATSLVDNDRLKQVRVQIAEVTDTMRNNVSKILQRGDTLEDLRDASERLNASSVDFQAAATRMKRRAWAQHMKTRAIMGAGIALILVCVLVPIIVHYSS